MKSKVTKIESPKAHFSHWAFAISECHYGALGVVLREYGGKKIAKHTCYTITTPPSYDFHEGDVFHKDKFCSGQFVQVAAIISPDIIEAHCGVVGVQGSRIGYIIGTSDLGSWLETGVAPPESCAIGQGSSRAGLLAWELKR